jgi:hypothetical protein
MEKSSYHSFLFRLWLVRQNSHLTWRASLENPHTGQAQLFFSLEDLIHFLQELVQNIELTQINDK